VYSSPLERARETAACIAQHHGMEVEIAPGLTEIDFGNWTGRTLADLAQLNEWKAFNSFRSGTRPPGGESAAEVLARALSELERLIKVHPTSEDVVALVSHGDVLRALVAHFLGMPMDLYHRLELSPASVSVLRLEVYGPQLLLLNTTGHLPAQLASRRTRS
jgi:probable phosphoglycerate mutase